MKTWAEEIGMAGPPLFGMTAFRVRADGYPTDHFIAHHARGAAEAYAKKAKLRETGPVFTSAYVDAPESEYTVEVRTTTKYAVVDGPDFLPYLRRRSYRAYSMSEHERPVVGSVWLHYRGQAYAVLGDESLLEALGVAYSEGQGSPAAPVWAGDSPPPLDPSRTPSVVYAKKTDRGVTWYQPLARWFEDVATLDERILDPAFIRPRFTELDLRSLVDRTPPEPFDVRCADALAHEVDQLVRSKVLDARSLAADALLDYTYGRPEGLVKAAYLAEHDAVIRAHAGTRAEVQKLLDRNRALVEALDRDLAADAYLAAQLAESRRQLDILAEIESSKDPVVRAAVSAACTKINAAREQRVQARLDAIRAEKGSP